MFRISDQYIWNFLFGLFFFALVVLGTVVLDSEAVRSLEDVTAMELIILSLATLRLTRLFVYDRITAFFREQFYDVVETGRGKRSLEKPLSGPRRTLADLLSCPWCTGMWMAATVVFFYFLTPFAWFPTLFLAVAGLGSLLQIFANYLGWKAEQSKSEVEG
jgi:hypothetical protein